MQNNDDLFIPAEPVSTEEYIIPQDPSVENTIDSTRKKSKSKFWPIFGIVSGAVVLTSVIIAVIVVFLSGSKYIEQETDYIAFTTGYDTVIVCENGEEIDTEIPGKRVNFVTGINGDSALLTTAKNTEDANSPKDLYHIEDGEATYITGEAKSFRLSAEGNSALYLSGASALNKIEFKHDKTTYIADQVSDYEISPDGSAAAYTVPGYGYTSVYYFNGSESILIDDNFPANTTILGLSDKGNYIYIKGNSDEEAGPLYRYTRKNNEYVELCNNFNYIICFNYNNTQILYTEADGSTYIAEKDDSAKQVSAFTVTPHMSARTGSCDYTYGIKNLCDSFYSSAEANNTKKLYYLDKKAVLHTLTENAVNFITISYDGDTAYFLTIGKNLYMLKAKANANGILLAENVDNFAISTDSAQLYFIIDGTLYYGFNELLSREVMSASFEKITVLDDDICVFSCSSGTYKCRKGRNVSILEYGSVDFFSYPNSLFFYKEIRSDMYELYSFDGEEGFELIGSSSRFY
ncbi:MAG: hypothetical protein E7384_02350 [Ruminococcaceae bacterium]|nr:hypothetical protein [Oscillospiraceae bacterium]